VKNRLFGHKIHITQDNCASVISLVQTNKNNKKKFKVLSEQTFYHGIKFYHGIILSWNQFYGLKIFHLMGWHLLSSELAKRQQIGVGSHSGVNERTN